MAQMTQRFISTVRKACGEGNHQKQARCGHLHHRPLWTWCVQPQGFCRPPPVQCVRDPASREGSLWSTSQRRWTFPTSSQSVADSPGTQLTTACPPPSHPPNTPTPIPVPRRLWLQDTNQDRRLEDPRGGGRGLHPGQGAARGQLRAGCMVRTPAQTHRVVDAPLLLQEQLVLTVVVVQALQEGTQDTQLSPVLLGHGAEGGGARGRGSAWGRGGEGEGPPRT